MSSRCCPRFCSSLALLLAWVCAVGACSAQGANGLNGAEGRLLDALVERFAPLPSVERVWTGAFVSAAERSGRLKAEVDSLQRAAMDETERLLRLGAIRQEMRTVRQDRNAFVAGFLSPLDQLALDSIFNPPAPSIQHFGFHDRMKCLVCKEPGALDVPPGIPMPTLKQQ